MVLKFLNWTCNVYSDWARIRQPILRIVRLGTAINRFEADTMISLTFFCSWQAAVIFPARSKPIPDTSSRFSWFCSMIVKVTVLNWARSSQLVLDLSFWLCRSQDSPGSRNRSRQGLFTDFRLELGAVFWMFIPKPLQTQMSPGETSGRFPTTVARPSKLKLDFGAACMPAWCSGRRRRTVYPFSGL